MGMAEQRGPVREKFSDPAVWGEQDKVMFVDASDTKPKEFGPADNGSKQTRDLKG